VPVEGNGKFQTLICVLASKPRRCSTMPNTVLRQSGIAAYTLQMKMLFLADQLWFMTYIRKKEKKELN